MITCVVLIDLCLGVFLCMRYLYEISNRCLVLQSHVLNILYEYKVLMHVCGILFGLNRIVCVTMYISIFYCLDFISVLKVRSIPTL
jgi:hypothetical protein